MEKFIAAADRFKTWCREDALPLWATKAVDPSGGFYEQLTMAGEPDVGVIRRVRVQSRMVYCYALAHHLGWFGDARKTCDHGYAFLMDAGLKGGDAIPGDGFKGCAHLVDENGTLVDGLRDTYAQAFLILCTAWRFRAFADSQAKSTMEQTLGFLDTHVKADNGGWYEGVPASMPRRQNPHMHMFESLLACYDATQDEYYLTRADEMFDLFKRAFFDEKTGVLLEYFNDDWSPAEESGDLTEPGHMMEWSWILRWYQTATGKDVSDYANGLYDRALELGRDEKSGFLIDECRSDGTPTKSTRRSWPQTELIKASVAGICAGRTECADMAAWAIDAMMDSYLNVDVPGGWCDQYNADGEVVSKVMPSSTFYHLICAAAEASAVADEVRRA